MESSLSLQQRDDLRKQLARRLGRLSDEALMELERLTQHPEKLNSFVPVETATAAAASQDRTLEDTARRPRRQAASPNSFLQLSRREVILAGVAGLFLLTSAGEGGFVAGSAAIEPVKTQLEQFEQMKQVDLEEQVTGMLDQWQNSLGDMASACQTAVNEKRSLEQVVVSFQTLFVETVESLLALEAVTGQLRAIQDSLDETGLSKPEGIQTGASLIESFIKEVPLVQQLLQVVKLTSEMMVKTPDAVKKAEEALSELRSWFSDEEGIDKMLLQKLRDPLFTQVDALNVKAQQIKDDLDHGSGARIRETIQARTGACK